MVLRAFIEMLCGVEMKTLITVLLGWKVSEVLMVQQSMFIMGKNIGRLP